MSAETSDEKKNATNFKTPVAIQLTKQQTNSGRDPRSRLFSDSSEELPRGILKNARVPTKRSASECVDYLSHIMTDLNLNIDDLSQTNRNRYCPYHSCFIEEDDDELSATKANPSDSCDEENDESDNDDDTDKGSMSSHNSNGERKLRDNKNRNLNLCDCQKKYRDEEKPMKSVRFDERVYELRIASRLYDRRAFTKYRLSSRHHPLSNQNNHHNNNNNGNGKSKSKSKKKRNKSQSSNNNSNSTNGSDNQCVKKQTKSQRAKQSKKAKKKLNNLKRDEHSSTDTSSDDQGYCSSLHSLSD